MDTDTPKPPTSEVGLETVWDAGERGEAKPNVDTRLDRRSKNAGSPTTLAQVPLDGGVREHSGCFGVFSVVGRAQGYEEN